MDKLHRLASGEGDNDIENGLGGDERLVLGDFARATAVVAKEGLREGLSHGKELDMQQGFNAGYQIGIEIGLVIGGAKALVENIQTTNHEPSLRLSGLSLAEKIDAPNVQKTEESNADVLRANLDDIEEDLRILKEFVSKKLVPNPNDSCCGGGDCGAGEHDGGESCGNTDKVKDDSLLLTVDPTKDQKGKAEDCLDFALKLRTKMDQSLDFKP